MTQIVEFKKFFKAETHSRRMVLDLEHATKIDFLTECEGVRSRARELCKIHLRMDQ